MIFEILKKINPLLSLSLVCLAIMISNWRGHSNFVKENQIQYVVLGVSGGELERHQQKHSSYLEVQYWIHAKYVNNGKEFYFTVENPFIAEEYKKNSSWVFTDAPIYRYKEAGYHVPFQYGPILNMFLFVGFIAFAIIGIFWNEIKS